MDNFTPASRAFALAPSYCTYCGAPLVVNVATHETRYSAVTGKPNQWQRELCCPRHKARRGLLRALAGEHDYWFEIIDNDPSALPQYVPARPATKGE